MSRFKKEERVQITSVSSTYLNQFGTVVETDFTSVWVLVDSVSRKMRFADFELIPAPHVPAPGKGLTRTQTYLQELDEDAKLMLDASDLLPNGSGVQKDLRDFAGRQSKIVHLMKQVLQQDGVKLWEDGDVEV